jgi:YggT family protein
LKALLKRLSWPGPRGQRPFALKRDKGERKRMFVLTNLIETIALLIDKGLTVYFWIIIIRALLSWVNPDPYNPIVRFLYQITEPVLGRIRRHIPYLGGIDVSPLIVLVAIFFIQRFVVATLYDFAMKLKTGN